MKFPQARILSLAALLTLLSPPALAETSWRQLNTDLVDGHVIPRYLTLTQATEALDKAVQNLCLSPSEPALEAARGAFIQTLDAWNGVSHLRFGPVETEQRYHRFAFWPDRRGTALRQIRELVAAGDPARIEASALPRESVAVQGLTGIEILLYPPDGPTLADLGSPGSPGYACLVMEAMAGNLRQMAADILNDWTQRAGSGVGPYRSILVEPGPQDARFPDDAAVSAEFLKALSTQLQVIHDHKLMLPLGQEAATAKPRRAESWRSQRSLANLCINLAAVADLYRRGMAQRLREQPDGESRDGQIDLTLGAALEACAKPLGTLEQGVSDPELRPGIERLRDLVGALQARTGKGLATALGLAIGFNSLDGD